MIDLYDLTRGYDIDLEEHQLVNIELLDNMVAFIDDDTGEIILLETIH